MTEADEIKIIENYRTQMDLAALCKVYESVSGEVRDLFHKEFKLVKDG